MPSKVSKYETNEGRKLMEMCSFHSVSADMICTFDKKVHFLIL